jgi:hypothetical protein
MLQAGVHVLRQHQCNVALLPHIAAMAPKALERLFRTAGSIARRVFGSTTCTEPYLGFLLCRSLSNISLLGTLPAEWSTLSTLQSL